MNKRRLVIGTLILLAIVGVVGGTIAFFSNSNEFRNVFLADSLGIQAIENFTSPDHWLPGETVEKRVRAKNTSRIQMAVRISYTERWEDREGNILDEYYDGEKAAIVNLDNEDDWLSEIKNDVTYYYYYKLLEPEEETTDFMNSVTFNEKAIGGVVCTPREDGRGEECKSSTDYEDATYYLTIKIEMIAYDKYKESWETDVDIAEEGRVPLIDKIKSDAVIDNVKSMYVSAETGVNFENTSSDTNGKGVYLRAGTENDEYPIYYYRGEVYDNNVIFADFCWKIIRTTETGGIKMIYNGPPKDGQCNNTGIDVVLEEQSVFNDFAVLSSAGYMYGNVYTVLSSSLILSKQRHSSAVTWDGTQYTLSGSIKTNPSSMASSWVNYVTAYSATPYTCKNSTGVCNEVYFLFYTNRQSATKGFAYYIKLSNGETFESAKEAMLRNENDSEVKKVVDNWYANNLIGYTSYLEDTVWCNDRSLTSGGFVSLTSNKNETTYFGAYDRIVNNFTPSLTCVNENDRFTVSPANGNGALTYPVALITADEYMLAGGEKGWGVSGMYLNNGSEGTNYWFLTPNDASPSNLRFFANYENMISDNKSTSMMGGVRPSISLNKEIMVTSGEGTTENPYVVLARSKNSN